MVDLRGPAGLGASILKGGPSSLRPGVLWEYTYFLRGGQRGFASPRGEVAGCIVHGGTPERACDPSCVAGQAGVLIFSVGPAEDRRGHVCSFFRGCFETPVAELRCCHQSRKGSAPAGEGRGPEPHPAIPGVSEDGALATLQPHSVLSGRCTVGLEGLSG